MIIFTIAAANHLAYAKTLARSVKQHAGQATFVLFLAEHDLPAEEAGFGYFDHVIPIAKAGVPDFDALIHSYNRQELIARLKPYLFLHLLDRFTQNNKFVYLDADIRVYGSFDEVDALMKDHSILLTPHRLEPDNHPDSIAEEKVNLKNGIYQDGFLALKRSDEAYRFLKWWAARCRKYAVADYGVGLYMEQKWLNLVPCFFREVGIIRHPGYNVASWNLSQRVLKKSWGGQYTVNGRRLIFFHFSGIGKWLDKSLNLHAGDQEEPYALLDDYLRELSEMGHGTYAGTPWDYDKIMRYEAKRSHDVRDSYVPGSGEQVTLAYAVNPGAERQWAMPVDDRSKLGSWLSRVWKKIRAVVS